jgi:hypothetical protein
MLLIRATTRDERAGAALVERAACLQERWSPCHGSVPARHVWLSSTPSNMCSSTPASTTSSAGRPRRKRSLSQPA